MNEKETAPARNKMPKRSILKIVGRILKYFTLGILVLLTGVASFGWWVMESSGGQAWLVKTINGYMVPEEHTDGIFARITGLKGTLPFNFTASVSLSDGRGVWLDLPEIIFFMDWKKLPGLIQLDDLSINNPDLVRLPELPPAAPKNDEKPFTIEDFKTLLAQLEEFLTATPWWLPEIMIKNISVQDALLPGSLLPQKEPDGKLIFNAKLGASFRDGEFFSNLDSAVGNAEQGIIDFGVIRFQGMKLALKLNGGVSNQKLVFGVETSAGMDKPALAVAGIPEDFLGEKPALNLSLNFSGHAGHDLALDLAGPDVSAGQLTLKTRGEWHSGKGWEMNELAGPVSLLMQLNILTADSENAKSPLEYIQKPASLGVAIKGDLPRLGLDVKLDCASAGFAEYHFADISLALQSSEIDLPLSENGLKSLEDEKKITTSFRCDFNGNPVSLHTDLFLQALKNPFSQSAQKDIEERLWRTGLHNLAIDAMGIKCKGDLAAIVAPDVWPLLDGDVALTISDWKSVSSFLPNLRMGGNISLDLSLDSTIGVKGEEKTGTGEKSSFFKNSIQKAGIKLKGRNLSMRVANEAPYEVGSLSLDAEAEDIFRDMNLDLRLLAQNIKAAGLSLSANAAVKGSAKGPLEAAVKGSGDVNANVAASWEPGKVNVKTLDFAVNAARFLKSSKKAATLAINMTQPAVVTYGEAGLNVAGLDVRVTPSGRLKANGGLSPDKLDLSLELENLLFKPWQALVPAIPEGSAGLNLKLTGTPQLPGGTFRASLRQIKIPGASLAPVSLNMDGALRHSGASSVFGIKADIDQGTLKTLGATAASISASIPLIFNANGIPALNTSGNLQAKVRWDGSLGPLWNLVPVADQRLNGRIGLDLDASGTMAKPRIAGTLKVSKARYENLLLGVLLTDMNLSLAITDKGAPQKLGDISLSGGVTLKASLSDGHRGTMKIDGTSGLDGEDLKVSVNIDRLKPLRRRDIHVEVSGALGVKGSAMDPDVSGDIVINRGEILLDNIAMTSSVTTLDITRPKTGTSASAAVTPVQPKGFGNLDIGLRMLPRFRVDGRGLGSVWQANLQIEGPLNNPQVTGTVSAVSGNFDFLGKIFELTKGNVTFAGGSLSNPLLDIELTNETPDLTAHIMVLGPVNKMRLVLTSDPSIPRDEILSRVLFGKSINDLSRLEALQLAAAVAQLAGFGGGGGIMNFTKKALGIDVLRVGTSSSGAAGEDDSGAGGTTIEAGKYITDQLYMGVQQGMKADSTAFIIQFELTPRTSLEVRSEQNNTWGGLNWKYNY